MALTGVRESVRLPAPQRRPHDWQHSAANRIESVATLGAAALPVHVQGFEYPNMIMTKYAAKLSALRSQTLVFSEFSAMNASTIMLAHNPPVVRNQWGGWGSNPGFASVVAGASGFAVGGPRAHCQIHWQVPGQPRARGVGGTGSFEYRQLQEVP